MAPGAGRNIRMIDGSRRRRAVQIRAQGAQTGLVVTNGNRQSRQRLDRHGTIVVGSCETFHHYNVQGVK